MACEASGLSASARNKEQSSDDHKCHSDDQHTELEARSGEPAFTSTRPAAAARRPRRDASTAVPVSESSGS